MSEQPDMKQIKRIVAQKTGLDPSCFKIVRGRPVPGPDSVAFAVKIGR